MWRGALGVNHWYLKCNPLAAQPNLLQTCHLLIIDSSALKPGSGSAQKRLQVNLSIHVRTCANMCIGDTLKDIQQVLTPMWPHTWQNLDISNICTYCKLLPNLVGQLGVGHSCVSRILVYMYITCICISGVYVSRCTHLIESWVWRFS